MASTVRKTKIVGNSGRLAFGSSGRPRPKKKKYHRVAKKRSNVGDIVGFTLAGAGNPGRRKAGSSMAKTKKKRHASRPKGYGKSHYKAKGNPGHSRTHKKYHRRRHGNPGSIGSLGPMVTNAVFVIVGALGSKLGAQAVLGSKNVGLLGYAANAGAGGVLWFLTEKVMKNRAASTGVLAGTIVQIVLRIINDYTPFGSYVAQLGMGDYQMQSFVTPQVLVDPWRNADVAIPSGWAPRMLPPPATAGPGGAPMASAPAMGMGGGSGLYGGGGGWGGGLYSV
jgi:hypothetical protein